MINYFKRILTDFLLLRDGVSASSKINQRTLYLEYRKMVNDGRELPRLDETGFRVFSQFEEDGKLLFIFAVMGISNGVFVDIGSADGINSNCANLALNFSWHGLFVDSKRKNVKRGRRFYNRWKDTWFRPPIFVEAVVSEANVNEIIREAGLKAADLLSIDIDGNDYHVWKAIDVIDPKVIIIETNLGLGLEPVVEKTGGKEASIIDMVRLGEKKGYYLAGANKHGFNLIFIRRGLIDDLIPKINPEKIIRIQSYQKSIKP